MISENPGGPILIGWLLIYISTAILFSAVCAKFAPSPPAKLRPTKFLTCPGSKRGTFEIRLCVLLYNPHICTLNSGFLLDFKYQGGVKSTVFGVFEDLKFKISEVCKQN